jgi:hypothetical protein
MKRKSTIQKILDLVRADVTRLPDSDLMAFVDWRNILHNEDSNHTITTLLKSLHRISFKELLKRSQKNSKLLQVMIRECAGPEQNIVIQKYEASNPSTCDLLKLFDSFLEVNRGVLIPLLSKRELPIDRMIYLSCAWYTGTPYREIFLEKLLNSNLTMEQWRRLIFSLYHEWENAHRHRSELLSLYANRLVKVLRKFLSLSEIPWDFLYDLVYYMPNFADEMGVITRAITEAKSQQDLERLRRHCDKRSDIEQIDNKLKQLGPDLSPLKDHFPLPVG